MRTSSQLTRVEQCEFHPKANITQSSDSMMRARAQKNVLLRMLRGEPINDIGGEIDSILASKRYAWENEVQRDSNLQVYENRIRRFYEYESVVNGADIVFPDDMFPDRESRKENTIVDFFGEQIEVHADYFIPQPNLDTVIVKKIKTGRYQNESVDQDAYETYTLGLLGEKLFPGKHIRVEIDYLGDVDAKKEREALLVPYMDFQKTTTLDFDETAKTYFEDKHAQELTDTSGCTPEECASCSMNGICHYEEPPISLDIAQAVRPISEIRLTNAQSRVVNYEQGVARINAGAGAGKTLVVAMRIATLLEKGSHATTPENQCEPEDICLLTFTNAGAGEMTARVVQYCAAKGIAVDPSRLTSTTFNSFCYNLIKEHYTELGYTIPPRVLPEETRSGIINRILDSYPRIEEWNYATSSAMKATYFSKNIPIALPSAKNIFAEMKKENYTRMDNPYGAMYSPVSLDLIFQMYEEFNHQLMQRNFVEFDDQIAKTFQLLEVHPNLFEELGYKHIIVDEFQDTDLPQIRLLNAINDTSAFKSFMAVGDDSQAIFSFRHTSPEYMINFDKYFGRYDDFQLVENHRSTENIIGLANKINQLNENRVDKDLIATKLAGPEPSIQGFYSQQSEYRYVAECIKRDIENGADTSSIAFLASTKHELTKMASILTEIGIPSILMNPIPYISNSRVAAVASLFATFIEGTNRGLLDYQNVLNHGALKGATAQEMEAVANEFDMELRSEERSAGRFLEYCKALDPEGEDECFQSFLEKFESYTDLNEMAEFFRDFKMYGQDSCFKREGKYAGVCLTTVHSAKGLEWDTTYLSLSKFDSGKRRNNANQSQIEETNRKWFVGTTRAREKLVMTGEFIAVNNKQKGLVLNDFVVRGYELVGKVLDYTPNDYWAVRAEEKANDVAVARSKMPTLAQTRKATEEEMERLAAGQGAANLSNAMTHNVGAVYAKSKDGFLSTFKVHTKKSEIAGILEGSKKFSSYVDYCRLCGGATFANPDEKPMTPKTEFTLDVYGESITIKPTLVLMHDSVNAKNERRSQVVIHQIRDDKKPLGEVKENLDIAALAKIAQQQFPYSEVTVVIDEVGAFGKNGATAIKSTRVLWTVEADNHYAEVAAKSQTCQKIKDMISAFEEAAPAEIEFE